ncbi:hypothetical protein BDZ97DRAFT_705629 [Flammula alnicola]|nr:hypothetical protein BDZ97DRAFT_705629 [Flammula alnicola]
MASFEHKMILQSDKYLPLVFKLLLSLSAQILSLSSNFLNTGVLASPYTIFDTIFSEQASHRPYCRIAFGSIT